MNPLWSSADFIAAIAPSEQPGLIEDVEGISIDSRTVQPGDAFFAIKGERFDGHAFARAALGAGASVVVLETAQRKEFPDLSERVVFVEDVLEALERLGQAARERMSGKVIAITGSVGKTSTKDALWAALKPSGKVHAAVSSFNNHWGVPVTLARMPQDTDFGIFEVGMNHPGEIRRLIGMVRPDLAMITTIVAAHIGNFATIDEIAAAKAEIFEGVVPGGAVLFNGDIPFSSFLDEKARGQGIDCRFRFGTAADADVRCVSLKMSPEGSDLDLSLFGRSLSCHIGAPGEHLAMNALAVLGAVELVGGSAEAGCQALSGHGASKGRGKRHELSVGDGSFLLVDESYNANPSSVAAALQALGLMGTVRRKIAVLGDMLELGEDSAALHEGLIDPLMKANIDLVYLCGPEMAHLLEKVPIAMRGTYAKASADLIAPLADDICAGDVVMVKGSLGSKMGPVVTALLDRFEGRTGS
ncbi:UDP-N-acetylmuramoylalanyl-D-glutamyl-2,6-diaminopimelate--D-alanyl-D-alanine ligase [uncultured Cohaesibacter sp.]|uniref:UDP-N-acetylmuramoylalanyl-D-glutamyl-2, 6-diaminopimelate--D-alanyl-D-alanine ligase n=1 Tax=uncultured Cohaesibacter sp. TaxID=1002546 RepID=UPI0029311497|nr:UDP-N-acetylmuramoylalanyl-D-glutamyl-2,6-diaminopimelate--D-alanyl-D-alanine ligase [uncultured Cohaesibacter sp.]